MENSRFFRRKLVGGFTSLLTSELSSMYVCVCKTHHNPIQFNSNLNLNSTRMPNPPSPRVKHTQSNRAYPAQKSILPNPPHPIPSHLTSSTPRPLPLPRLQAPASLPQTLPSHQALHHILPLPHTTPHHTTLLCPPHYANKRAISHILSHRIPPIGEMQRAALESRWS